WLSAQCIDPAQVRRYALAEGVHVIEADVVVMSVAAAVAPSPADGNTSLVEIKDVIVIDSVVGRLSDPDADGRRVQASAVRNQAVLDDVARDAQFRIIRHL